MDEPVRKYADHDAPHDLPRPRRQADSGGHVRRRNPSFAVRGTLFGRNGGDVRHEVLDAHPVARVPQVLVFPAGHEFDQRIVVDRQIDHQRDELVAARAVLAVETAPAQPQRLSRGGALPGTVSITAPSGVGTRTLAPSTASDRLIGRSSLHVVPGTLEEAVRLGR